MSICCGVLSLCRDRIDGLLTRSIGSKGSFPPCANHYAETCGVKPREGVDPLCVTETEAKKTGVKVLRV